MNNQTNGFGGDGLSGGFGDDEGSPRLIQGVKLKFSNACEWMADDMVVAADREFLVMRGLKALQKWIDGRPVDTQVFEMHEKLPDVKALNDAAPREEWRVKFGEDRGPWEWQYVLYLIDPKTMQIFTYPTNTDGGGQAVRDLLQAVLMARRMFGDNHHPRVRLSTVFMKTKWGGRDRPAFEILGYETVGAAAALPAEGQKQIEPPKPAEAAPPPATPKPPKTGEPKPRTTKF